MQCDFFYFNLLILTHQIKIICTALHNSSDHLVGILFLDNSVFLNFTAVLVYNKLQLWFGNIIFRKNIIYNKQITQSAICSHARYLRPPPKKKKRSYTYPSSIHTVLQYITQEMRKKKFCLILYLKSLNIVCKIDVGRRKGQSFKK